MFFTKEEYKKTMNDFLEDHHGMMVKISDDNGKIFGYIFRAEAIENDSKHIVFSIVPNFFYFKGHIKPSTTELKFYGIKRLLSKWKKVKSDLYIDLSKCIENSFIDSIKSDITDVKTMYEKMNVDYKINIDNISTYIHKNLKSILKYYKDKTDIKIIFL